MPVQAVTWRPPTERIRAAAPRRFRRVTKELGRAGTCRSRHHNDIPRTKSGKIVELAVRDVIHNRTVRIDQAMANPEALELIRNRGELTET
jgi:acyl-coenzyme A synthetase/AMP-(fatty) acid ligase